MTPERRETINKAGANLLKLDEDRRALLRDVAFWRSEAIREARDADFWRKAFVFAIWFFVGLEVLLRLAS